MSKRRMQCAARSSFATSTEQECTTVLDCSGAVARRRDCPQCAAAHLICKKNETITVEKLHFSGVCCILSTQVETAPRCRGKMCKVSIITASYNYARFIGEAIQSVQNQRFTDWELIIVDDGSQDNSVALIKEFEAADPRIKLFTHEIGRAHV